MTRAVVIALAVLAMLFSVAAPVAAAPDLGPVVETSVCDAARTVDACVRGVTDSVNVKDAAKGCKLLWFRRVCVCRPFIGCEPRITTPRWLRNVDLPGPGQAPA